MTSTPKPPGSTNSRVVVALLVGLVALNALTLIAAYPETSTIDPGCCANRPLAKDFSAYYVGAWRLLHDPAQVYTRGFVDDGEFHVLPQPELYKYLPSLLLITTPFLALGYQQALLAFDVFQMLLLPLMAFMVIQLTKAKGPLATVVIGIVVLLQPSPSPHAGFSVSYFWQWAEGQAKVFQTFLLLGSFYLGGLGRPKLSGAALGLSAFDPRFALLAVPLFLAYNKGRNASATIFAAGTAAGSNLMLLYPGMWSGFLSMVATSGVTTPVYYYALIPLLTVLSLTALNLREVVAVLRRPLP